MELVRKQKVPQLLQEYYDMYSFLLIITNCNAKMCRCAPSYSVGPLGERARVRAAPDLFCVFVAALQSLPRGLEPFSEEKGLKNSKKTLRASRCFTKAWRKLGAVRRDSLPRGHSAQTWVMNREAKGVHERTAGSPCHAAFLQKKVLSPAGATGARSATKEKGQPKLP